MNDDTQAEITTPLGGIKVGGKRMAETIAVFCLSLLLVLAYVLWEHTQDTRRHGWVK